MSQRPGAEVRRLGLLWSLRSRLGVRGRRRVRALSDPFLARLVGSIRSGTATDAVALTLDDGPDPTVTPALLDLFEEMGVHATFFLLSERAKLHPDLVERLWRAGHEVAVHGRDHRRVSTMSRRDVGRYLAEARADLEHVLGHPVRLYRPPYGSQSLSSYRGARDAGLDVVVWSADARDWIDRDLDDVVAEAANSLSAGGILLLHERIEPDPPRAAPTTTFDRVELCRRVVLELRSRQLEPVTVAELGQRGGLRRSAWFRP